MELELAERDFRTIRDLLKRRSGITLGEHKRALVYSRLAKRVRDLGLATFGEYLARLDGDEAETLRLTNALTTNVTDFFREGHHFVHLADQLLPELYAARARTRRLRLWSAACSTGQEPYSLAMVLAENPPPPGWDVKILATDIDSDVLATAVEGVYSEDKVEKVDAARRKRFFQEGRGARAGQLRVTDELRSLVTFRRLNLLEAWPMRGPFDAILCRNVIIYFDAETKRDLVRRFGEYLAPDGRLFLGHSESIVGATLGFAPCGQTIYRRTP
jgi:chemotaxis protein methyltransferase CheR